MFQATLVLTERTEMNLLRDVEHNLRCRSFFKLYLRSRSSNSLQIPPAFVSEMRKFIQNRAFLKSRSGKRWIVDVESMGGDMFFTNGWPKFVSDNSIEEGHFLVFNYNGEMTFDIMHFSLDACEVLEGEEDEEILLNQLEPISSKKKGPSASSYSPCEETIFQHGIVRFPKNPFFVTKLRRKKRNALFIPGDVLRDNQIQLPSTVMILDEKGRQIYTKVLTWTDGRRWIIDGWKLFVRNNHLTEEDRCICEFVVDDGVLYDVFLKMTILRAGSWLP